jgi:hypothetical protein
MDPVMGVRQEALAEYQSSEKKNNSMDAADSASVRRGSQPATLAVQLECRRNGLLGWKS